MHSAYNLKSLSFSFSMLSKSFDIWVALKLVIRKSEYMYMGLINLCTFTFTLVFRNSLFYKSDSYTLNLYTKELDCDFCLNTFLTTKIENLLFSLKYSPFIQNNGK